MSGYLSIAEWVDHLDREYLSTFVRNGGATVKFVVADENTRHSLKQSVETRAWEAGYSIIDMNAADCRFHMPQDIFFALAKQIDWRQITRKFILRVAENMNYRITDINAGDDGPIIESIARQNNNAEPHDLITELKPALTSRAHKNQKMAKDFRVAMAHLSWQELNTREQAYGGEPVIDWLTGRNTRVSGVRTFSIHTAINRTTARVFLESALYWLFHEVGLPGTLIMLDNTRVTVAKRPADGSRYYTRAAAMEHYEILRQFIDSAERLKATVFLTLSSEEFLNTENSKSMSIYPALQTRIMDDVTDRNRVNPNAPLIRLR